jgi:RNAse (barnase) inhibitor barstar
VREILLDGVEWQTEEEFYSALLPALGAPAGHGRNLDALNDTILGGDVNEVNPPFVVRVIGSARMGEEARNVVKRFAVLIQTLKAEGVDVAISLE